jgi:hypothetical protein
LLASTAASTNGLLDRLQQTQKDGQELLPAQVTAMQNASSIQSAVASCLESISAGAEGWSLGQEGALEKLLRRQLALEVRRGAGQEGMTFAAYARKKNHECHNIGFSNLNSNLKDCRSVSK